MFFSIMVIGKRVVMSERAEIEYNAMGLGCTLWWWSSDDEGVRTNNSKTNFIHTV